MLPIDRVRPYLRSVFQSASGQDDDDDDDDDEKEEDEEKFLSVSEHCSGTAAAAADDDDDHKGFNRDFDSDSSDDSLMMPSFSSSEFSSPFQPPSFETPGLALPEGRGFGIAATRDLPGLSGRGVDTSDGLPGFASATQPRRPGTIFLEAVASDPRLCVSFDAPTAAAVCQTEAVASVPAAMVSRPRGRMRYGTKSELCKFARWWQNFAERARRNGTQSSRELPLGGVILDDFRHVSQS